MSASFVKIGTLSLATDRGLAQERRQVLRRRIGGLDERVEVVERRPQVDEGGVAPARSVSGSAAERAVEVVVAGRDRLQRLVGGRDQRGQVVAAVGERAERLRARDEEARERDRVARELLEELRRRCSAPGSGTCRRGWRGRPCRRRRSALPWMNFCSAARSRGRKTLKSWSRSTGAVVSSPVIVESVLDARGALFGPGRERDVAVGDAGERGRADHRGRALAQRLVHRHLDRGLVVVGQVDRVDRCRRAGPRSAPRCRARAGHRSRRGACTGGRRRRRRAARRRPRRRPGSPATAAIRAGVEAPRSLSCVREGDAGAAAARRSSPRLLLNAWASLALLTTPGAGKPIGTTGRLATRQPAPAKPLRRRRHPAHEQLPRRRPAGLEHLGLVAIGVGERLHGEPVGDREQVRDRRLGPEAERDRRPPPASPRARRRRGRGSSGTAPRPRARSRRCGGRPRTARRGR